MKSTDYGFDVNAADFLQGLKLYQEKIQKAVGLALFFEATEIMESPNGARDQAPVDAGGLRESGKVLPPEYEANSVAVTLGFGDTAIEYAHRQHEELTWHHPKHGKAKYLEDPINAAQPDFLERVAAQIKGILRL
jgi:hypothetical protein